MMNLRRSGIFLTFLLLMTSQTWVQLSAQVFPDFRFRVEDDGSFVFLVPDPSGTYLDLLDSGGQNVSRFDLRVNQMPEPFSVLKPDNEESGKAGLVKVFSSEKIRMRIVLGDATIKGLPLLVEVQNISATPLNIRLSVLFNTVLGESGDTHFQLGQDGRVERVDSETFLEAGSSLKVLSSGTSQDPARTFVLPLLATEEGNGLPAGFYCANMFRLSESDGPYQYVAGRNFSYLPFSVNDSGVRAVYPEVVILPGQARQFALIMAWAIPSREDFLELVKSTGQLTGQGAAKPGVTPAPERKKLADRLAEINLLIKRLKELTSQKNYNQAELERIIQRLEELKGQARENSN